MNILITVESYYPLKNGVQEITQRYSEFLSKTNNVKIMTRLVDGTPREETYNGVEITRIELYTKKSIYQGDIYGYRKAIAKLTDWADVMINVCTQTAFTDCILKYLDNYKCKKILFLHGMAHFTFPKIERVDLHDVLSWLLNVCRWRLFYHSNRKFLSKYDAIIHLHQMDPTFKMCNRFNNNNYVLENTACIKDEYLFKSREDNSVGPYIMIANYIHDKNQELAIKAYFSSKATRDMIFVGGYQTAYLNKLKTIVNRYKKRYKGKNVIFIIGEEHSETMKRLASSFALIHTSKSEKYPVVISEAMAFGIPFIATNTGIIKHLPGGIVCDKFTELVNSINTLEESESKREELSSAGVSYSRKHQSELKNCQLLSDILKKCADKNAS